MISESDKKLAADCNGLGEDWRCDEIRSRVGDEYYIEDEIAIVRKMLMAFYELSVHGTPIPDKVLTEFLVYFHKVENIKKEVDGT